MEVLGQKAVFLSRVRSLTKVAIALSSTVALVGCGGFAEWIAVRVFYREAVLVRAQVYKDLNYWADLSADQHKHRLDFYVPEGTGWSVLIFVHGGGWGRGGKGLEFWQTDPYCNNGRFLATRGIGVAIVNYRLQPAVTWRDQVKDVAQALAWIYRHAEDYGADKRSIFISGHSSGAQLATRAALDRKALQELHLPSHVPCGVIAVSGAPFDISDRKATRWGQILHFTRNIFVPEKAVIAGSMRLRLSISSRLRHLLFSCYTVVGRRRASNDRIK